MNDTHNVGSNDSINIQTIACDISSRYRSAGYVFKAGRDYGFKAERVRQRMNIKIIKKEIKLSMNIFIFLK